MELYDVIIIGKGPSGISASLYTQRGNLKTLIIGRDGSSLEKAGKIENYYGLTEPISGEKLLEIGVNQAETLGIQILDEEVTGIEFIDDEKYFKVITNVSQYYSLTVLIAAGQPNKKIPVEGIKDYEGKGVSYCTTCDGFFYRDLCVGVLGNGAYAVHEATELEAFTKDITLFTNGTDLNVTEEVADIAGRFKINTEPLEKVTGGEYLNEVCFKDGRCQKIDGLFIAYGTASSVDFATKLGVLTKNNAIIVDTDQNTNVPGIFASGDCTGGLKQISTAVGQGAVAGKSIIKYVRKLNEDS